MQEINSDLIRGNIDTIILKTMLSGDMYGLDIIREVENKSNGTYELKQPTLYSCLKRLENQELISSYWLDSDIGGKRHYYKLTDKGRETIKSKQDEWSKSKLIIDNLLGDFDYDEYRLVKKDDYDKIINGKPIIQYVNAPSASESETSKNDNLLENNTPINIQGSDNEIIDLTNPNIRQQNLFDTNLLNDVNSNNQSDIETNISNNNLLSTETMSADNADLLQIQKKEYEEVSTDISTIDIKNDRPDPFDNEVIFFKPKTETSETDDSNHTNVAPKFEQTSTFANNNLFNNFELSKTIIESNKPTNNLVQEDLFKTIEMPYQSKVDNVISEFSENITKLNNFNYSGDNANNNVSANKSETENTEKLNLTENNVSSAEYENNEPIEDSLENEVIIEEEPDIKNCYIQDDGIDILSELDSLNSSNPLSSVINFKNDDTYNKFENTENFNNNANKSYNESKIDVNNANTNINNNKSNINTLKDDFEIFNFGNSNDTYQSNKTKNLSSSSDTLIYQDINSKRPSDEINYNLEEERNYESLFAPKEDIDDIIYKNVSSYTYDNQKDDYYSSLSNLYTNVKNEEDASYKQKVEGLTAYAKNSNAVPENIAAAKDIQSLKEEYKKEGIIVKDFNKTSSFKSSKNYVLINKLNLIKSLILLFGYVFILSALFIIMDSTDLKNMTDFSFVYFIYGFIPFIIYFAYYLVLFLLSPHRKIPAKHSSRIMLIISIIISIQLILITYCLNLQLGFYSFYQANYNHLLWIIPTIVSFAPICSTVIYSALYRSKNFNI